MKYDTEGGSPANSWNYPRNHEGNNLGIRVIISKTKPKSQQPLEGLAL